MTQKALKKTTTKKKSPTRALPSSEIIFAVTHCEDGGYEAKALGHSIFSQAENLNDLHSNVRDAVKCHFDKIDMPKIIRLHYSHDEVIAV